MTQQDPQEVLAALETLFQQKTFRKKDFFDPYEKQQAFFDLGAVKRERLLMAGNQQGKAERDDMPVLTPTGWKAIAALRVGDLVIGGDGKPCSITGVFPQGEKETAELFFDDGASVVVCTEHLWKVRFPKHPEWRVLPTFVLPDPRKPVQRARIPTTPTYLPAQPVPLEPYALGLLLGDGCFRGAVRMSSADPELVAAFPAARRVKGRQYDFALAGLAPTMRALGLMDKMSVEKFVPEIYKCNSYDVRLAILQGLMDTDGTAGKDGTFQFYSISPRLAADVQYLVRSLGGKAYIKNKQTFFTHRGVKKAGQPSFVVIVKMPVCPFRLSRKVERWYSIDRTNDRILHRIEPRGRASCTCIAVDSPDHTYVTKDFIVTHNTYAGAFETACHLTGEYPDWWLGRRFDHAVTAWAAGVTSLLVRDGPQKLLCGQPGVEEAFGTGLIPKESFVGNPTLARGVTNAYDTLKVRHKDGGVSTLTFKSYEQGEGKFQSTTLDFLWLDEEPDEKVYGECLARITATDGMLFMTFTPLLGMSSVVKRYLKDPSPDRGVVQMTIEDAKHIAPEKRQQIIDGYLPHEREARARGVPMLGSGRIHVTPEGNIITPVIDHMPLYWTKLWALDFGINERHKFAAVLGAWDRDNDIIYLINAFKEADTLIMAQARKIKQIAGYVPVTWPQDGHQRDKSSGEPLAKLYKKEGLLMTPEHATWEDGGSSTEAAIAEINDRLATGRLKVYGHLAEWFEEYRSYHRRDGKIVREDDDLMGATQKLIMAKRWGKPVHLGPMTARNNVARQEVAEGVEFDPF